MMSVKKRSNRPGVSTQTYRMLEVLRSKFAGLFQRLLPSPEIHSRVQIEINSLACCSLTRLLLTLSSSSSCLPLCFPKPSLGGFLLDHMTVKSAWWRQCPPSFPTSGGGSWTCGVFAPRRVTLSRVSVLSGLLGARLSLLSHTNGGRVDIVSHFFTCTKWTLGVRSSGRKTKAHYLDDKKMQEGYSQRAFIYQWINPILHLLISTFSTFSFCKFWSTADRAAAAGTALQKRSTAPQARR